MSGNNTVSTSKTDWARVDAMTDDEIDTSDSPELTGQFFARAKRWSPSNRKSQIAVTVDEKTLAWFEEQGDSADQHLAAALRIYAEAQKYTAGPLS